MEGEFWSRIATPPAQKRSRALFSRGLRAGLIHGRGEVEDLVDPGDFQRIYDSLASANDDQLAPGVLTRDVGAHKAPDAGGIYVRHVGYVDDQQVGGVGAHHRLEGEEVTQQQRTVETKDGTSVLIVVKPFDGKRFLLHNR